MRTRDISKEQAQRLYGVFCGSSNLVLAAVGAVAHDPLIQAGAGLSIAAQAANTLFNNRAQPLTTPVLVASGAAFAASGLHPLPQTGGDFAHLAFGACKMAGVASLFHREYLGHKLVSPAARLVRRVSGGHGELMGEILLAVGAASWAADGTASLIKGLSTGDPHATTKGAATLAAMGLFVTGNHFRARAHAIPAPAG